MKSITKLFAFLGLALAAHSFAYGTGAPSPRPDATTRPAKLEGMTYVRARQVILSYGWYPLRGNCGGGGAGVLTCRQYPEIGNCSGSSPGYCDMTFVRKSRCLTIVTVGGAPVGRGGDTVIESVMFSRGRCSKEPNEGTL